MRFAWDERKNRRNRLKHGVSFETACLVFDDPAAFSFPDRIDEDGVQRWRTVGWAGDVMLMLVAHTFFEANGEEIVRIISARKATPLERREYEEAH